MAASIATMASKTTARRHGSIYCNYGFKDNSRKAWQHLLQLWLQRQQPEGMAASIATMASKTTAGRHGSIYCNYGFKDNSQKAWQHQLQPNNENSSVFVRLFILKMCGSPSAFRSDTIHDNDAASLGFRAIQCTVFSCLSPWQPHSK